MMKKLAVALLVIAGLAATANAAIIVQYSFNGSLPGPTAEDANITATDFAVSAGVLTYSTAVGSTAGGGLSQPASGAAGGWNTGGPSKYFSFSFDIDAGFQLSLTDLSFAYGRTATGPQDWQVHYSTDGFSSSDVTIGTGAFATSSGYTDTLWGSGTVSDNLPMNNLTGTVEFRIYGYNATSTGNFRIDEVVVNGAVTAIPEPTTLALLGLGVVGLVARRRMKK